jgi:hypothetical protein
MLGVRLEMANYKFEELILYYTRVSLYITADLFSGSVKHLRVFPPISKFEEIDITKALTSRGRLHYPKIAKKSRLDEFLTRRTHLKILEERKLAQNVCSS